MVIQKQGEPMRMRIEMNEMGEDKSEAKGNQENGNIYEGSAGQSFQANVFDT